MNPAAQNAAAPGGQQEQQQGQRPSMLKMMLIYVVINYVFTNFFGGNKGQQGGAGPSNRTSYNNLFYDDEPLVLVCDSLCSNLDKEFKMFVSSNETLNSSLTPAWEEKDIKYNFDKENYREKTLYFEVDELLATNCSLFAHFVLSSLRPEHSINYTDLSPYLIQTRRINLTDWRKKDRNLDQANLLFDDGKVKPVTPVEPEDNETDTGDKLPHLRTKVWIQLVHDANIHAKGQMPPEITPELVDITSDMHYYIPTIDVSQFWARKKDFALIAPDVENKTLNTTFYFNTYWFYKYMLETQMKGQGSQYAEWGIADNLDEIKEMILDANPYLFAATIIVSTLHSLFEFLAIKNEISFWKNLDSHRGLSLRTLWYGLATEIIVLLYLLDNDTSFLILLSTFAGIGVSLYKIFKTTKFSKKDTFPYVTFDYQDAYKSTTQEYDQAASKYLGWLLIPLLAGYTVYSLVYEKHRGWYSFVIQTLVGFIYVFGFIEMTPQLYINYKLKSVEHLPWRVLIYKFLNTIVDDFFAFVITMPWLKRLSCFRDDVIFLIYLYQRWIYRVDKTRDPYGNAVQQETTGTGAAPAAVTAGDKKETKPLTTVKKRMGGSGTQNVTQRNVQSEPQGNSGSAEGSGDKKTN